MFKTSTIYFVLLVFCAQAAMAGVDVHVVHNDKVDIVHHYIDNHGNDCEADWDEAAANISFSDNVEYNQSNHSEGNHHGCSGHITSITSTHFSYLNPHSIPAKAIFNYLASFYSLTQSPSIRPPIFS